MNAQLWRSLLASLACLLASATWAQDSGENTYRPLFPPETIEAASPEQARRMRHTIEQLIQADQARSPLEGADLPEEIRRHIRALGYFE